MGSLALVYGLRVVFRMRRTSSYLPALDDWLWYAVFPLVAYLIVLVAAIMLVEKPVEALFGLAAATILLIFMGIRNAWDVVTFIAVGAMDQPSDTKPD